MGLRLPVGFVGVMAIAVGMATVCATAVNEARAGEMSLPVSGTLFNVPVQTLKEARFKSVVSQQYDYSCGSAAVATLLTYHYEDPVTEVEVFETMFEAGDKEQITSRGFSLLDMKNYVVERGYLAEGFLIGLEKIAEVGVPGITVIDVGGYKHFVVIKGIDEQEVLVGDPAVGLKVYSRAEFEEMREGDIIFVIISEPELGTGNFNQASDWAVRAKAPFGSALSRQSLATFTVLLPGRNEF